MSQKRDTATKTEFLMSNGLCNFYLLKVMGSPYAWSVKSISVVKEYNLKRHYKSRHEAISMTISESKKLFIIRGQEIIVKILTQITS